MFKRLLISPKSCYLCATVVAMFIFLEKKTAYEDTLARHIAILCVLLIKLKRDL